MACGLRIKFVPRSVFLAVCNRGSPLFIAGAYHTYKKKNLAFIIFYSATAQKNKKKKTPPALPRCGADLPSTAAPHATERRQPTTQSVGFFVFVCCVCSGCGTDEPQEGRHTGSSAYQFPP